MFSSNYSECCPDRGCCLAECPRGTVPSPEVILFGLSSGEEGGWSGLEAEEARSHQWTAGQPIPPGLMPKIHIWPRPRAKY